MHPNESTAYNQPALKQFVHLHLHTQYSLLDGANKILPLLEHAAALGQPAVAMTDHGNLCGAIEFYSAAKKVGIKPILGCEFYITPGSRFERKPKKDGGAATHHITVLAMNEEGYRNLSRLSTLGFREGFYHKPRIDHEILSQYSDGLIATSGCMTGELNGYVMRNNMDEARAYIQRMHALFGDRFYLEIQPHPLDIQQRLNSACGELSKEFNIPLVATTDCHYLRKDDHFAQEILMCISTGKLVSDPDRLY